MLPSFSIEPHHIPFREYFSRIQSIKILYRTIYLYIFIFSRGNYDNIHEIRHIDIILLYIRDGHTHTRWSRRRLLDLPNSETKLKHTHRDSL